MTDWTRSSLHAVGADPARCCKHLSSGRRFSRVERQCSRPRGYGPEQAYCKQHDPAAVEARREKSQREFRERMREAARRENIRNAAPDLLKAAKAMLAPHGGVIGTPERIEALKTAIAKAEGEG